MSFSIPESELEFKTSRSGGPGGQHVNQSSTKVEVRWNVRTSTALTEEQRGLLESKLGSRIDSKGFVRVAAEERRSQLRNREAAIERLNALVLEGLKRPRPRKKTKPSKAAKERRLESKRRRSKQKKHRRPVDEED